MAYRYPYGNTEQMNLDWFLKKFRELQAAWDQVQAEGVIEAAEEARRAANEAIAAAAEAVETAAEIVQSSSQIATNTQNIDNLSDTVNNLDSADIADNSDAGGPTVEDSLTALKSENDDLQNIVGNGSLSGFTATDLTGAANELKGSLNTEVTAILNAIAFIENSDIATRNYYGGEYVYITSYNRLYRITSPVTANSSMTGKVTIAQIGNRIEILNNDINAPMTQYYPDLFWANGTPTLGDAGFFYKKIGSGLLYLAGRFVLRSKNISVSNDSLSISLPNGYKVSIRTYAPLGSFYDSGSITNMVLLGLANATSIYIGVGAGGGYSANNLVDGGIYSFSCLVPVTNS